LGEDVANLQLDLAARLVPTTFEPVTSNDNREAGRAVEEALKALIRECYGRDGQITARGELLGIQGAGYRLGLGWWGVRDALAAAGTSFQTVDVSLRLDLVVRDLLLHPQDPADADWAWSYGYRSPDALARAFRYRFGLGIGEVRRIGTVSRWMAMGERDLKSPVAVARRDDAAGRIHALKKYMQGRGLGPDGMGAFATLNRRGPVGHSGGRPRYPVIGRRETMWLERLKDS
jgi:hypothetical protein